MKISVKKSGAWQLMACLSRGKYGGRRLLDEWYERGINAINENQYKSAGFGS